eukprot:1049035_1
MLFYAMLTIISLHCLGTFLIALVSAVLAQRGPKQYRRVFTYVYFIGTYLGMAVRPILITKYVLLQELQWRELQSWMLSYIVWGCSSFITSSVFLVLLARSRLKGLKGDQLHAVEKINRM